MVDVYKEEDVIKLADEFAKKSVDKLKGDLVDAFYQDVSNYLHEHYQNNQNRIERQLISSICEEYVKDPKNYKFADLRKKMFLENKEEIVKTLSDEAIASSVENVIEQRISRDYHFEWRWKDGIAKFVVENLEMFKEDKRVQEWITRDIKRRDDRIAWLEEKLREVSDVLND